MLVKFCKIFLILNCAATCWGATIDVDNVNENQNRSISVVSQAGTNIEFVKIGSKYYIIETKAMVNWFAAAHTCRSLNAHLAIIDSEQEMTAMAEYLTNLKLESVQYFWYSANNLGSTWSEYSSIATGLPMAYVRWGLNQPDNQYANEHCAHLWPYHDWSVNDNECWKRFNYICQLN